MLKVTHVSMRNFLSVGNATQALELTKTGLTLILGENLDVGGANSRNGVGKSTILQAISFGLFGVPLSNIKKDNLVNSINSKNMVVSISFERDGKKYKIERGRKPQFVRYYVDDGLVAEPDTDEGQGDSRNTQAEIEKVLGFSHDMFCHIIAMNTSTEPFLKLRPGDQRSIIEELLGIMQISTRSDVLKELIKSTKDSVKEEEFRIKAVLESNNKIQASVNDLEVKSATWDRERAKRISNAEQQLDGLQNLDIDEEIAAHKLLVDFRDITSEITRVKKDLHRSENELMTKTKMYDRTLAQLAIAEEHKCHACGQEVHNDSHEKQLNDLKKQIDKIEADLVQAASEVEATSGLVKELTDGLASIGSEPTTIYNTLEQALSHRNTINNLMATIIREEDDVNPYKDQIQTLSSSGIQPVTYDDLNELQSLLKHQDFLLKLLINKDSFIRKKIIDQNINHLNHRLNYYLEKLGLPHEVQFKSDLNVEISLLGRDFDFEQLSRGEKNRVILSTSWAFRDVWESLNQSVNLLFIDEMLDSGIDFQGGEAALEVLKLMARERHKSIFLISHKEELIGRSSNVLKVIKENGFTKFQADAEDAD